MEDGTLVFEGCVFPQILTGDLESEGIALFDGMIDAVANDMGERVRKQLEHRFV